MGNAICDPCCNTGVDNGEQGLESSSSDDDEPESKKEISTTKENSVNQSLLNSNNDESESDAGDVYEIQNPEKLLESFEASVISKDFDHAMALYEKFPNIGFLHHEFFDGTIALHYAVEFSNSRFLSYLLQEGIDVNYKCKKTGDTALHIAIRNEDARMIVPLLTNHANIDALNYENKTPYDIAIKTRNNEIIEMFDKTFLEFLYSHAPEQHKYKSKIDKIDVDKHINELKKTKQDNHSLIGQKLKKKRKLWKPRSMRNIHDNNLKMDNDHYVSENELSDDNDEYSTDEDYDETLNRKRSTSRANAFKKLGITSQEYDKTEKLGTDVSDILLKLKTERIEKENQLSDIANIAFIDNKSNSSQSQSNKYNNNIKNNNNNHPLSKMNTMKVENHVLYNTNKKAVNMISNMKKKRDKLPVLASWLEKKKSKPPKNYQKRFLCVIDGHLLWNDKKINVRYDEKMNQTERTKYRGSLNLMLMDANLITASEKHGFYKFKLCGPNIKKKKDKRGVSKSKQYTWRCRKKQLRDDWVKGLKIHINFIKNELKGFDTL